jgi:hypothetical protein
MTVDKVKSKYQACNTAIKPFREHQFVSLQHSHGHFARQKFVLYNLIYRNIFIYEISVDNVEYII